MLDTQPISQTKCIVFMPARNCEMYAAEALRSLARQTHEDIHVVYVDDASEDQTGQIARHYLTTLFAGRHDYIRNKEKFGKSRNIWEHLRPRAKDADFIAILDADDQLVDTGILAEMAAFYNAGKDIVWSNFFTDTRFKGQNRSFDPSLSPREQSWRTSHFFSFRAALLGNIPESYFKDANGKWFLGACDVALALPLLDQTRDYEFIPKLAYRYTASNPYSLHNQDANAVGISSALQSSNAQQIIRMKPLPLWAKKSVEDPVISETTNSVPANPTVALSIDQSWQAKAADSLLCGHPQLLIAQSLVSRNMTPLQLLSLKQMLNRTPGPVLCLGGADIALLTAALAGDDETTQVTCLAENAQDVSALRGKAAIAGVNRSLTVLEAPPVPLRIGSTSCPFPSLANLEAQGAFSVVVADATTQENEVAFGVMGLPAMAKHFASSGFHYCALTSDLAAAESIAAGALSLVPSLTACPGAFAGTGCVIFANEKEQ